MNYGFQGVSGGVNPHPLPRHQVNTDTSGFANFMGRLARAGAVGAASTFGGPAGGAAMNDLLTPGGGAGGSNDPFARMQELLALQMQVQAQMQTFSTQSNIAKTSHDARMTAVRNMRA